MPGAVRCAGLDASRTIGGTFDAMTPRRTLSRFSLAAALSFTAVACGGSSEPATTPSTSAPVTPDESNEDKVEMSASPTPTKPAPAPATAPPATPAEPTETTPAAPAPAPTKPPPKH
jgi:hypothetical protein